jgi:lysophospholipase L1-like esterase
LLFTGFVMLRIAFLGLVAVLTFVLIRENYPERTLRRLFHQPTPVTETRHYQHRTEVHARLMQQISPHYPVTLALIGDSLIENWMTEAPFPNSLNLGIGRDTLRGVQARANPSAIQRIPIWYLGVGVNDILRGQAQNDIEDNARALAETFGRADLLIWRAVLPVSRPDWTPLHEQKRLFLNTKARELCGALPACIFLPAPDGFDAHPRVWTNDGLHPNATGYQALTQQLSNLLASVSKNS